MTIVYPADAARVERPDLRHRPRARPLVQGRQPEALGQELQPATPLGDLDRYERLMVAQGLRGGEDEPHRLGRARRDQGDARGRHRRRLGRLQRLGALHHGLHRGGARAARQAPRPRAGAHLHVRPFGRGPHRPQHQLHARAQRRPRRQALLRRPAARRSGGGHVVSGGDEGRQGRAADERRRQGGVRAADRRRAPDVQQHLAAASTPTGCRPAISRTSATTRASCETKGIANYRMYEVRGTSHSGGESLPDSMQRGDLQNIDVSKADGQASSTCSTHGPTRASRRHRPAPTIRRSAAAPTSRSSIRRSPCPRLPARSASTTTTRRPCRARRRSPRSPARASSRSTARTSGWT